MSLPKLLKTFQVERKKTGLNGKGARAATWIEVGTLRGVLADASPHDRLQWKQMQYPVTHQIVQPGAPQTKQGDRLLYNGRKFYVQGVENPGELNAWTIIMCEEREDA